MRYATFCKLYWIVVALFLLGLILLDYAQSEMIISDAASDIVAYDIYCDGELYMSVLAESDGSLYAEVVDACVYSVEAFTFSGNRIPIIADDFDHDNDIDGRDLFHFTDRNCSVEYFASQFGRIYE